MVAVTQRASACSNISDFIFAMPESIENHLCFSSRSRSSHIFVTLIGILESIISSQWKFSLAAVVFPRDSGTTYFQSSVEIENSRGTSLESSVDKSSDHSVEGIILVTKRPNSMIEDHLLSDSNKMFMKQIRILASSILNDSLFYRFIILKVGLCNIVCLNIMTQSNREYFVVH